MDLGLPVGVERINALVYGAVMESRGIYMSADKPTRQEYVAKLLAFTDRIGRIYNQHVKDYAAMSPTPDGFEKMRDDLGVMQKDQPNYSAADLATTSVPVLSVLGEHDEFIKREHAEYIARAIPNARFEVLPGVSHFAPLQRPDQFNRAMLDFLQSLVW